MHPAYIEVLKDSFLANFIFTLHAELAYPFMLVFGGYDEKIASIAGLIGSVAGLFASFLVFYGLYFVLKKLLESNPSYPTSRHYINKLSPLIGVLFALPQLSIIPTFFFGITRLNLTKFLLIAVFYRVAYYAVTISTSAPLL